MKILKTSIAAFTLLWGIGTAAAQVPAGPIYENLQPGAHPVGFKIFTITDPARVSKGEFDYLGNKIEGDRTRRITIHLWYPANHKTKGEVLTYGSYCYNHLQTSTKEAVTPEVRTNQLNNQKNSVRNWFGMPSEEGWNQLVATKMLAHPEAKPAPGKFPLLVGILRPLSTTVVNELLASHGYMVAMVRSHGAATPAATALEEIPDMQFVVSHLITNSNADASRIGTFGFSGSGFTQVLFAMFDPRIKALADIESGIYMEGLYQGLSASNFYSPAKLRVPFLHIFSADLSKEEKYLSQLTDKTKFSQRYRLILNQPGLHHWDFASEGFTSCIYLKNRGAEEGNIRKAFEISAIYLLKYFDAILKGDAAGKAFVASKPTIAGASPASWNIDILTASTPAPNREDFEMIVQTKGIDEAMSIVRKTLPSDSASNLNNGRLVNTMGYSFLQKKQHREAIEVFKLNASRFPENAGWTDSLAEAYETSGDKENMKAISQQVLEILSKKATLTPGDQRIKDSAERRLKVM